MKLKLQQQRLLPEVAASRKESELPNSLHSFAQLKLPLLPVLASPPGCLIAAHVCLYFILNVNISVLQPVAH